MGAAYYIVLDHKAPDFDTFVDGKAMTRELDAISAIAASIGVRDIHDFASFAAMAEDFDIDPALLAAQEKWFPASEGIAWMSAIRTHIESNPDAVKNADAVRADLSAYLRVLEQAARIDARWHLEMDF